MQAIYDMLLSFLFFVDLVVLRESALGGPCDPTFRV